MKKSRKPDITAIIKYKPKSIESRDTIKTSGTMNCDSKNNILHFPVTEVN